jgi:hypothetical protein
MKIILTESQCKLIIEQSLMDRFVDLFKPEVKKPVPVKKQPQKIVPFTPENFAKEVVKQNIEHPEIAIAQAMIESGHFTSNIFKSNNNPFGMKFPEQRKTLASSKKLGHAFYNHWTDAVKDYKLWQTERKLTGLNSDNYLQKLNKLYCFPPECGHNDYAKKVKSLLGRATNLISKAK